MLEKRHFTVSDFDVVIIKRGQEKLAEDLQQYDVYLLDDDLNIETPCFCLRTSSIFSSLRDKLVLLKGKNSNGNSN